MRAAKSGDVEVMRLLLAAGADPKVTMPNGSTALMFAAGLGWRDGSPLAPSYDQGTKPARLPPSTCCSTSGCRCRTPTSRAIRPCTRR